MIEPALREFNEQIIFHKTMMMVAISAEREKDEPRSL